MISHFLLDFFQTNEGIHASHHIFKSQISVFIRLQNNRCRTIRQHHWRDTFFKFFFNFKRQNGEQFIHKNQLARVAIFTPRPFHIRAPTCRDGNIFVFSFYPMQASNLTFQFSGIIVKLSEKLTLPTFIRVQIPKNYFCIYITCLFTTKAFVINAVIFRNIVIRTLIQAQWLHFKIRIVEESHLSAGVFYVKIFSGYFFPFHVGFPIVSAFFPKCAFFFIAPTFAYVYDVIIFTHLAFERQSTEFSPPFFEGIATQFHFNVPIFYIVKFIVKRKFCIDIGGFVPVKYLTILLSIVRQPFCGRINFQFAELRILKIRLIIRFAHHHFKVL